MFTGDRTLKVLLATIALLLGMIAVHPFFDTTETVLAQTAKFDHVFIVSTMFLYKGQQGLLVMDRRNANVWFIPKVNDQFQNPVFVIRVPFEKLDQAPQ
jgi:hypothetical protein